MPVIMNNVARWDSCDRFLEWISRNVKDLDIVRKDDLAKAVFIQPELHEKILDTFTEELAFVGTGGLRKEVIQNTRLIFVPVRVDFLFLNQQPNF